MGGELEELPQGLCGPVAGAGGSRAAGCVALRPLRLEEQACEKKRLWVGDGFRGLGLGRRPVEKSIGWAERQGYEPMYLDTVPAAMRPVSVLREAAA
jgi:putative acetyltransferase